ncbi:MAG: trypsin-like peptidase domain-containing protein [Pirellulaceae bacterium]|nr:trypsin-like peptidase domain-containing protein [Pirellulaceae bacterium]
MSVPIRTPDRSPCARGSRRALALATALLLSVTGWQSPAAAQGRPDRWPTLRQTFVSSWQTTPHPAVARVIVAERDGASVGSGTLVDAHGRYGLVVTNWHVVRDAQGPISVVFPDGFRSAAQVLKLDEDWDLAALAIWRPKVAPVPLATEAPRPGDMLTIAGYGSGSYRATSGPVTQYVAPEKDWPYEMVELAAAARQGDSGGPIFNRQGQLAGVLFGSNGQTTSGSYAGRVQQFLAPTWQVLRHPEDALLAQQQPAAAFPPHSGSVAAVPSGMIPLGQPLPASGTDIADIGPLAAAPAAVPAGESDSATGAVRSVDPPPLRTVRDHVSTTNGIQPAGSRPIAPPSDERSSDQWEFGGSETTDGPAARREYIATRPASDSDPIPPAQSLANQLLGESPLDWAKSLFSLIGIAAVLLHVTRMLGRPQAADDAEE